MVQTDGSKQDVKRVRELGEHCKRALYMRLNVPVKQEPENSGSSEKPPKPKDDAATSSIMTRLLGFQLDVDVGQEDPGASGAPGHVGAGGAPGPHACGVSGRGGDQARAEKI